MLNARTLFPPLFRPVDSGGGGNVREKIAEIDSQITRIDSQITDISGDITQIDSVITRLSNNVGDLSQLDTTDKSSLVGAVNEVASSGGGLNLAVGQETEVGTLGNATLYGYVLQGIYQSTSVATLNIDHVLLAYCNIRYVNGDIRQFWLTDISDFHVKMDISSDGTLTLSLTGSDWSNKSIDVVLLYTKKS